jgi:ABC-type nitrate/sulfonate/bicarbonate transport system ATPase subunit
MKQRLALLRTYMTNRQLLLLDEPFGALDALTRIKMQDLLLERWEQDHRTVLFITHDVEEALLLGDRVVVMSSRPGQVREIVDVDIPRPRYSSETVTTPRFVALKRRLLGMLLEGDAAVEEGAG